VLLSDRYHSGNVEKNELVNINEKRHYDKTYPKGSHTDRNITLNKLFKVFYEVETTKWTQYCKVMQNLSVSIGYKMFTPSCELHN
jgi:hypothetical protein